MNRNPRRSARYAWTVTVVCCTAVTASAQTPSATTPPLPSKDIVVIALGSTTSSSELRMLRLASLVSGQRDVSSSTVRDVQLDIVSKTAAFGPVLVVAPDEETRSAFHATCDAYGLCEHIANGRVRTAIVPHDTPWIRDYGPLVELDSAGNAIVTDATYYDVRQDISRNNELRRVTMRRKVLVEELLTGGRDEEGANGLRSRLGLWREYADVLRDEASQGQRPQDDSAHFDLAQSALAEAVRNRTGYVVRSAPLYLDGGNLLRLDDGATCLTTRDIFTRNRGKEAEVTSQLQKYYGCTTSIYLEALPGPVIEHVDMFALPVRGGTVLLADFGLHQPHIERAWRGMSAVERELTFQASLAMDRNHAALRAKGLRVISVPALPPRTSADGAIFYPTQLNALVRANGAGRLQVLLPTFEAAQKDVQDQAIAVIQEAFGATTEIVPIEATVAAEAQGAVHCLTITMPFEATIFRDEQDVRQRQIWALREHLEKSLITVNRPALQGRWTAGAVNGATLDIGLQFSETRVQLIIDGRTYDVAYSATKEETYRWPIELSIDDGRRKARGRVDWLSNRSFRFVLEGIEPFVVLRDVRPEDVDAGERLLPVGSAVAGALTEDDDSDASGSRMQAWKLVAQEGQELMVSASSGNFDAEVYVIGPDGTLLASDDDSGGRLDALAFIEIPNDGEYRVVVKSHSPDGVGAFELRVDDVPSRLDSVDVIPSGTLVVGTALEAELQAAGSGPAIADQGWTLERCGGQTLVIELSSDDFDPMIRVVGADLAQPLENDDYGDSLNSRVELQCQENASYTVVVSSVLGGEGGRYRLTATPLRQ